MEAGSSSGTDPNEESVDFACVTVVASRWMLDFCFTCLCRHFREGRLGEFNNTLSRLEAICQGCKFKREQAQKKKIAAFLGRIMHGKELGACGGKGNETPLMAAIRVWKTLKDTVADENVYDSISTLLHIQSVAVCLEKGQKTMASTALKWLEERHNIPKNLAIKLSTLVVKGDIYHPFMRNFSYQHLLEKVGAYLDSFLAEKPPDFLFQAAAKVAASCQNRDASAEQDASSSETTENPSPHVEVPRKRLLAAKQTGLWMQEACEKPPKRRSDRQDRTTNPTSPHLAEKSLNTTVRGNRRRGKRKWTPTLDKYLLDGVKKHGEGNWKLMLLDHNYWGRTGTMLKDRWRILKKTLV